MLKTKTILCVRQIVSSRDRLSSINIFREPFEEAFVTSFTALYGVSVIRNVYQFQMKSWFSAMGNRLTVLKNPSFGERLPEVGLQSYELRETGRKSPDEIGSLHKVYVNLCSKM